MFIFYCTDILISVLEACDLAVKHAFDSYGEVLQHAKQEIEIATRELHEYEDEFCDR